MTSYFVRFDTQAQVLKEANWSEATLIEAFREGLNPEIQKLFVGTKRQETFIGYTNKAQEYDNEL